MSEQGLPERLRAIVSSGVVAFLLVVAAFGLTTRGRAVESPDARFYLATAEAVKEGRFGVFLTRDAAGWSVIGFPLAVAVIKAAAPEHWLSVILALNLVCAGLTGALLTGLARRVTGWAWSGVLALLLTSLPTTSSCGFDSS
jgi:hypothetical protein